MSFISSSEIIKVVVLEFILKVVYCLFLTAVFSLFSCESDSLAFNVLHSTIYMLLEFLQD